MNEDDRLVQFRHVKVKPTAQQLQQIERLVTHIEKTLKQVSDHLHENGMKPPESSGDQRILKGIMRVGLLAKNILLSTDTQIELVVLCSQIPTHALLHKITEHFLEFGQVSNDGPVSVSEHAEQSAIHVTMGDYQCCVYLTSVLVRANATGESKNESPEDALPVEPCLKALAELRHAKWYQVKCLPLQHCGMMLRIIRDVRSRVTTWEAMTSWTLELLVERTLASIGHPVGPAAALRYIFEMLSSGVIINSNPWLFDPCEKEQVDVLADLTGQQREDITSSAQHALRLIAFDQIHVILGMDDRSTEESAAADRKRSLETNGTVAGNDSADAKKIKEG
ncbi:DZF family protein [Aphelenchoides avenae]|nr:DZF family protein [Aphelenchus avenae]